MSYLKKHNKFILIFLGILLTLSVFVGVSYAYYMVTASQTNKNRLASSCISISLTNEKNDLYSVSNSNLGNGALDYPIGLITVDELCFAGMNSSIKNKLSYLYSDSDYWTMSPFYYIKDYASVSRFMSDGIIWNYRDVTGKIGVRPVINLKSDGEISGGIGSINDPYIVKTN